MWNGASNSRGWLRLACASLAIACSSTPPRGTGPFAGSTNAGGGMSSGGGPSPGGMMVDSGIAPANSAGPCDPDLIYASVLEDEQAALTWLDPYLSGQVAIYQGQWSAEGTVESDGSGPEPTRVRVESTRVIATLSQEQGSAWWDEWRAIDGAWLWLRDTASESRIQLVQPSASRSTTFVDFDSYTSRYFEFQSRCTGCVVNLAPRPNTLVTQMTHFARMQVGQQEVALNLDLELIPPAQLTGETLVTLAYDRSHWNLVSGQWIRKRSGHYQEPGSGNGPHAAARYTAELFIDDAQPSEHGVRAFRVVACN